MRSIKGVMLAAGLLGLAIMPATAQIENDLEDFWNDMGASANITAPGHYDTQRGGHMSFGSAYIRTPVKDLTLVTFQAPGWSAGCGGIDAWAGGFSHIDADAAIEYGKAVMANAASLVFKAAIEGASPALASILDQVEQTSDWINSQTMNSCEMAEKLTGSIQEKLRGQDQATCERSATSSGLVDDRTQARAECGQTETAESTATPEDEENVRANRNIVWEALKKAELDDNRELARLVMTMTGVRVLRDNTVSEAEYESKPPTPLPKEAITAFIEGGDYNVLGCLDGYDECLRVDYETDTISAEKAFLNRSIERMDSIANAIKTDAGELSDEDRQFIQMMPMPVYRMLIIAIASDPNAERPLIGYAEYMSEVMAYAYFEQVVQVGSEAVERSTAWTHEEVTEIRDNFHKAREMIEQRQMVAANRLTAHMEIQTRFERMEERVQQALAADLARAYAVSADLEFN